MSPHIGLVPGMRFAIEGVARELHEHPEVWDEIPYRTVAGPHRHVSDIWVRYNPLWNFHGNWDEFNGPHESEWYPVAEKLPCAVGICLDLAEALGYRRIGGVLITKVPAGRQVYPHIDRGWHARFYEKFIVQIESNVEQGFCFEGERLSALPGQVYWFDNSVPHWVENPTEEDRVSLIVCLKKEPPCH